MLLNVRITDKSFGDKQLYHDLQFTIEAGEKVGFIGRNGTGKSTLLHMITGEDTDYQGEITAKQGITITASRQEHHGHTDQSVIEYIQGDLPEFKKLHTIITDYPLTMGNNTHKIQQYSDALERFSQLGYFELENQLSQSFEEYQLAPELLEAQFSTLSGGQKRMVELIKVQHAHAHLTLIDEPTNHMDYIAKEAFTEWLTNTNEAVIVITHDRDVLAKVDKIIEIRDGQAYTFRGNYQQYLRINTVRITSEVTEYDHIQRRIQNLKEDLVRFRRLKERARDPGTIRRFKSQEEKVVVELAQLSEAEKPSFWIDRENASELNNKMTDAYQKYKARNIQLNTRSKESRSSRLLVEARDVSLSYGNEPLFAPINFSLHEGERIRLHGRNGAGKTTLVDAITARIYDHEPKSHLSNGRLTTEKELTLGLYEQEIDAKYLPMRLYDAIELSFLERDIPVSDRHVKQLLGEYLFNPLTDGDMLVNRLSGGQKARFQLIRMLLNDPAILILDEPTNHLDLPSIEELEDALATYHGAIIYISHDSYFATKLGGKTIAVSPEKQATLG